MFGLVGEWAIPGDACQSYTTSCQDPLKNFIFAGRMARSAFLTLEMFSF